MRDCVVPVGGVYTFQKGIKTHSFYENLFRANKNKIENKLKRKDVDDPNNYNAEEEEKNDPESLSFVVKKSKKRQPIKISFD